MNFIWDTFILNPMINALLWLYGAMGGNFFLAIAVFTIVLRMATIPTTIRQQRSARKMQAIQPQVKAIQAKYKDNQQKQLEELRKIGYNPTEQLAGCLPMLVQMPIMIGLYRAILIVLGATPQSLLELTQRVYASINISSLLPIENKILWLNLAQPDPYLILPFLVLATSFISQKVLAPPKAEKTKKGKKQEDDNPMAGMTESMQYTMPIMFGFFALQFPSGLSIYWIITSLVGFVIGLYTRRKLPQDQGKTGKYQVEMPAKNLNDTPISKPKSKQNRSKNSRGKSKKKKKKRNKQRVK